ncbi:MAG: 2'-5' RNA ligase family protein [Ruminococcaceae bacterium]|nr:2'-5' RNA ligase family protein [Oscillospiraceae bacterium]
MERELMWICAIVTEEFWENVTRLCLTENKIIGLPENVFKLPLHISLKKSFYTDAFDSAKGDILKIMNSIGQFRCHIDRTCLHWGVLWLSLMNDGHLRYLHEELDCMLQAK